MEDTTMNTQLQVRKDALHTTQVVTTPEAPLADGQVRVRIEQFSFTSNNITYAAFGDAMNYWQFFPTGQDGWGCIPVWGFGTVVQSSHAGVAVGERLYGYWPFATHTLLSPGKLTEAGFADMAPHRTALHAVYNQYMRCNKDPFYTPDTEDIQALLRPLFITSFLIDDFMADNAFFGAKVMLLSSASSKTAYGTAFQLHQRQGIEVVGLTSEHNRAFCESLGCYHRVLSYEQLGTMAPDTACVYIDFAGNAALRRDIHTRFAGLAYSCSIGGTHVDSLGSGKDLPGPKPTLFFAPAQIKKRYADWGPDGFVRQAVTAWRAFCTAVTNPTQSWLQVQHHHGVPSAELAYAQVLAGKGDARVGHVVSMHSSLHIS
jgi:Protein of unknown function (DUF2855)